MPWSGGVYTRGYPSWTNDANNNLPISATKFDTEDNDFAAGLNNCLTIDGLNKPTATLNWSQIIALTRASDGTMASIARTGGSTNPSLTWTLTDSGNHVKALLNTGNSALDLTPAGYNFGNTSDAPTFSFFGDVVTSNPVTGKLFGFAINSVTNNQSAIALYINSSLKTQFGVAGGTNGIINGSGLNDLCLNAANGNILFSSNSGTAAQAKLAASGGHFQFSDQAGSPGFFDGGYLDSPQNLQGGSYQLVLADRGKSIHNSTAGGLTLTIPANSSVAFPIGTVILVTTGSGGGGWTIQITTDTLVWSQTGGTGTRTLAGNGSQCSILKIGGTQWLITGIGLS